MPEATFSACFGALPFSSWCILRLCGDAGSEVRAGQRVCVLGEHRLGGGPYGSLKYTRQVIDSIHDGSLVIVEWEEMPVLGLLQPKSDIKYVPKEILRPQKAWTSMARLPRSSTR